MRWSLTCSKTEHIIISFEEWIGTLPCQMIMLGRCLYYYSSYKRSNGEMDHRGNLCFLGRTRVFWVARTARCPGGGRGCIITGRTWWVSWQIIITVPHNTLLQVSCYSTARMDRVLFTEAGAEAGDPGAGPIGCGADQETETRGLDTFGGCLSSLTR